jgi:hypothetical protein
VVFSVNDYARPFTEIFGVVSLERGGSDGHISGLPYSMFSDIGPDRPGAEPLFQPLGLMSRIVLVRLTLYPDNRSAGL